MSKQNGQNGHSTGFDFSHLYKTETVDVKCADGSIAFSAVVREITHAEQTRAQTTFIAHVEIPLEGSKKSRTRQIKENMKAVDRGNTAAITAMKEEIAGIASWTLKDANGNPVPVCYEAWEALPEWVAKQISDAIERLNPEIEDDFQEGAGSTSES